MHREWRERFPRHRLHRKPLVSDSSMHHDTCLTHVPWCMSGSLTRGGGENVPGIPGACATRNFTYLARGPWHAMGRRRPRALIQLQDPVQIKYSTFYNDCSEVRTVEIHEGCKVDNEHNSMWFSLSSEPIFICFLKYAQILFWPRSFQDR